MTADLLAQWAERHATEVQEPKPAGTLRFALYARVSTEDNQDPESSLGRQRADAEAVINGIGVITQVYFDIGQSRTVPWTARVHGSEVLAALDDVERGWDALVVGETSRCFVNTQFSGVEPRFSEAGVKIFVRELGGPYDSTNSTHDLQMGILGNLGQSELTRNSTRVRGSMLHLASTGTWLGGRATIGYVAVGVGPHPNPGKAREGIQAKQLKIDPDGADAVRRIFREALEGKAVRAIARDLNTDGIACPSARDPDRNTNRLADGWQYGSVHAILRNITYCGYICWGRTKKAYELVDRENRSLGKKHKFVPSDTAPVVSRDPVHEPIVSLDDFMRYDSMRVAKSAGGKRSIAKGQRTNNITSALYGRIRCSECTRIFEYERTSSGLVRYRCRARDRVPGSAAAQSHPPNIRIKERDLLAALQGWLVELFDAANIENTIDRLAGAAESKAGPVTGQATLARDRTAAMKRKQHLIDSVEEGLPFADVKDRLAGLGIEIDALDQLIANIPNATVTPRLEVERQVRSMADNIDEIFGADAEPAELQTFYRAIGLSLEYDHKKAEMAVSIGLNETRPTLSDEGGANDCVRGGT